MLVRENIRFERGVDPKKSMGIGLKVKIEEWLKEYNINNAYVLADYTINTYNEVDLNSKGLYELPEYIKFNEAHADFHFNWNNLKTLKNGPIKVYASYYVNGNPLISLEGMPKQITGSISISAACGFTEEDIKKVCDCTTVHLTSMIGDKTFEELQKIKPRHYIK